MAIPTNHIVVHINYPAKHLSIKKRSINAVNDEDDALFPISEFVLNEMFQR